MKAHHGKCHLLLSTQEETNIQVSGTTNKNSKCKRLYAEYFDDELKFDTYIENICQKANRLMKNYVLRDTSPIIGLS